MQAVPYPRLRAAERQALKQFPDAQAIKALWTPASSTDIHVEVWHGKRASVHAVKEER